MTTKTSAAAVTKNLPAKTIRIGYIAATIWRNTVTSGDTDKAFYTVTFTRSFRDGQGEWADTTSFNHNDLPVLTLLSQEAELFIRNATQG